MFWHSIGRSSEVDTQPITDFFADRGTANMIDSNIMSNDWTTHESSPVGLATVNPDRARPEAWAAIGRG
jgi:hypothetical protein